MVDIPLRYATVTLKPGPWNSGVCPVLHSDLNYIRIKLTPQRRKDVMCVDVIYLFDLDSLRKDPEKIPTENPEERKGTAGADSGCGDFKGEY